MGAFRRLTGVALLLGGAGATGGVATAAHGPGTAMAAPPTTLEQVADETGVLSISVPSPWTAVVDGRPDELSSGVPVATLLATPAPAPFGANVGPGVHVLAPEQPLADLDGFLAEADLEGCTRVSAVEPWQHPSLTGGLIASWTCGVITHYEAVANTADGARLIWVQLNVTAAEEQFRQEILDSLTYTPAAASTSTTQPQSDGTAPTVPKSPTEAPTVPAQPTAAPVTTAPTPAPTTAPSTGSPTAPPDTGPLDVAAALAGLGRYTAANPIGIDDPGAYPPCPLGDVGMLADAMRAHGLEPITDVLGSDVIALGEAWPQVPMVFCPMRAGDLSMVPRGSLYAADISAVAPFAEVLAADGGVLVDETPPFGGEIGGSCYDFEGRFACWAMWHLDGLMLDVYVTTAPGTADDRIAVDLLLDLAPTMVARLAAA